MLVDNMVAAIDVKRVGGVCVARTTKRQVRIPVDPASSGSGTRRRALAAFTLDAQPRSVNVMSGDARRLWEHSIPPVDTRRYSITFRTMV